MTQGPGKLIDANMVAITFEYQTNDKRNKTVHMFKTGGCTMSPVVACATTVRRLKKTIPEVNGETTVCSYSENGMVRQMDSSYARIKIKSIVEVMGEKSLGFTKDDVGLHSIRSG